MNKISLLKNRLAIGVSAILLFSALTPLANGYDVVTIDLNAGEYKISNRDKGQIIEMEGFGYLMVPGKPMLPAKNFLIVLPPGASVISVEVKGMDASQLPGTYRIMPTPPIMPLVDPRQFPECVEKVRREWQRNNETVYSTDQAYPNEQGRLTGSGTLRKYSYTSVCFYPFSYHPQSGRLVNYDAAQIIIKYDLPSSGSLEARRTDRKSTRLNSSH